MSLVGGRRWVFDKGYRANEVLCVPAGAARRNCCYDRAEFDNQGRACCWRGMRTLDFRARFGQAGQRRRLRREHKVPVGELRARVTFSRRN